MREIASFEDERAAKLFADLLCTREIETEVNRGRSGAFGVWVLEERHVETARALWAAFDSDPDAPEHRAAAGAVDRKHKNAEARARESRHEIIDLRGSFRPDAARPARATFLLVAVSVAVALLTRLGTRQDLLYWLLIGTPEDGRFARVLHGEVWRLVTPIFVHFGILHVLFNLWWLLDLGAAIEQRIGSLRLFAIVLVTAIASNVAQYVIGQSPSFGGMSGVLYALFGYAWLRGKTDASFGLELPPSTVVVLMVWLGLGVSGVLGNVANIAHIGGLIAGGALGVRVRKRAE